MSLRETFFEESFKALTDHSPMRWQTRLYQNISNGNFPDIINIPTGLGKTSVIPIWLISLVTNGKCGNGSIPRKLIYIVNRRTVVDQATEIALKLRERLLNPDIVQDEEHKKILTEISGRLYNLSSGIDKNPLAISTLRGEVADNEEWKMDPARPAIIIGTIDMIGSKILFSGYGDGRYHRAHHAGLLGQDSLIIHDESHLTPAFGELLAQISKLQRNNSGVRPIRIMELSATPGSSLPNTMGLEPQDEEEEIVRQRICASKTLFFHSVEERLYISKIVEIAIQHETPPSKVLIYVYSPEMARKVSNELQKHLGRGSENRIAILTGTIRGYERDKLVRENKVYRALMNHEEAIDQTVYLVSTSAGEVGVDFDADHLVCDLVPLDSMIQRLGRVNRCGGVGRAGMERRARVDIVTSEDNQKKATSPLFTAIARTKDILTRLPSTSNGGYSASSRDLLNLLSSLDTDERAGAFSPRGEIKPLTEILLDHWSMTSISKPMPGRPQVSQYLHGITQDPPETFLVWRLEVPHLEGIDDAPLEDWFRACRIESHERLRERTDVVKKVLKSLLEKHRKAEPNRDFTVILLDERGNVEHKRLSEIVQKEFDLEYLTVIMPTVVGGLTQEGMLSADTAIESMDVAEAAREGTRRRERWLHIASSGQSTWIRLLTGEKYASPPEDLQEVERITLSEPPEAIEEGGEFKYLVLLVEGRRTSIEDPELVKFRQKLNDHNLLVKEYTKRICDALGLSETIRAPLMIAAQWHDSGKSRRVWQLFAKNQNSNEPLAKSDNYSNWRLLGGYRHEFGSLIDAVKSEVVNTNPDMELILHLIAAHHGWARPHFEPSAYDQTQATAENERISVEVSRRFARLQQHYGWWTLAWLEALLRCADIAASRPVGSDRSNNLLEGAQK
ncbi:MAG: type I-U CRISPR-associated helicase/endonuclease Cas3 [Thermoplasmata archaeon]